MYHLRSFIRPFVLFSLMTLALIPLSTRSAPWNAWRPATCMPDACFCEAIGDGFIRHPIATWSNLAFVLAGLLILEDVLQSSSSRSSLLAQRRTYGMVYAVAIVLIGLDSWFYHASLTFVGQWFDVMGMYLLGTFMVLYNVARLRPLSSRAFAASYVLFNIALGLSLIVVPELRRYLFGVLLVVTIALEVVIRRRHATQICTGYFIAAFLIYVIAQIIWTLDLNHVMCDSGSVLQGHAVWHVLTALSAGLLYLYYRSENNPQINAKKHPRKSASYSMHITILAAGSRGDIQPYLALGIGLQAAGHRVRFAAFRNFASLAGPYGLEFAPVDADFHAIMGGEDGQGMVASGSNFLQLARGIGRTVQPILTQIGDDFWRACQGTELIISGLNGVGFFGYEFADQLGVPCINASVVPLMATREFANLMWPWHWQLGGTYNLLTHRITALAGWKLLGKTVNRWRRTTLNLPPISRRDAEQRSAQMPMLVGISPQILPKPHDWPDHFHLTGYWFLPRPIEWTPPDDLVHFLAVGDPPVCFSFGSMTDHNSVAITQTVIAALKKTSQRGIIVTAWGGLQAIETSDRQFAIDTVPFDWLWPRCAAVVHHGGSGATSAGLRAGVPSLVVAFMADQPFWGRRIFELGCGPRPIRRKALAIDRLAAAIEQAVTDRVIRDRAADIGQQIRSEDGIVKAAQLIEKIAAESK
jgi:sterol 3beta-glucosyltransferase